MINIQLIYIHNTDKQHPDTHTTNDRDHYRPFIKSVGHVQFLNKADR